ncbi:MAG: acyloxyacyl hydrolase [Phycisphaerales bacterium]
MNPMHTAAMIGLSMMSALGVPGAEFGEARVKLEAPAPKPQPQEAPPADVKLESEPAAVEFGRADSQYWSVGAGIANNFSDETDGNLYVGYSYFVAQDIEIGGELGVWYYGAEQDVFGVNPNLIVRWHFVNTGAWTVYTDVGIGLLATTDDVPDDGTSFNFTPRAGGGVTRRISDSGARLQLGLRWAHISNARIEGDENNPSRDSIMLYGGVIFPF